MKKIYISSGIFCALMALMVIVFPHSTKASMKRMTTSSLSYSQKNSSVIQKEEGNAAKGYRGLRSRRMTSQRKSVVSSHKNSRRTTLGLRKSLVKKQSSQLPLTTVASQSFLANEVPSFIVTLPKDFQKDADTLTSETGNILFSRKNETVKISALGNICDGGSVFVQDCLNKQSDIRTNELEQQFPSGIILEKKIIQLREKGEHRFEQENAGKWFLLDVGDKKIGVLTFFDSEMNYLWQMEIVSPDTLKGLLNNDKLLVIIKESLFQSVTKKVVSSRVIKRAQKERTSRLRSGVARQKQTVDTFSTKDTDIYTAKKVPFTLRVPKGFSLDSDTIDLSSGKINFISEEGSIEIFATKSICSNQSFSVERKCIEQYGAEEIKRLKAEYPQMVNLGTKNYRLHLTTDSINPSVARGVVLMNGVDRVSTFVFAEPTYGNMWKINTISHLGQRGVLGDVRKSKELMGSLRFLP